MGLRKGLNSDLEYIFEIETKVYDKPYWNKKMLDEVLSGKTENRIWIYELNKKISPLWSAAYDSEIFAFPSLSDFTSEPFKTIPASNISIKK